MRLLRLSIAGLLAIAVAPQAAGAPRLPVETAAVEGTDFRFHRPHFRGYRVLPFLPRTSLYPGAFFPRFPAYPYWLFGPFVQPYPFMAPYYNPVRVIPFYYPHYYPPYPPSFGSPLVFVDVNNSMPLREVRYEASPPPEREPFYLERAIRPEKINLAEVARRQLVIEKTDAGTYLLRWRGPADEVEAVSFRVVDAKDAELDARAIGEPPFLAELKADPQAAAIEVAVRWKRGLDTTLRIPTSRFDEP